MDAPETVVGMIFGAPQFLIWALLIPMLLLLWFLKIRRRPQKVGSTLLWSRALEDERVRSPFQRLVRNLLLVFQLLTLILLILALLRPESGSLADTSRLNVFLVDRSASMNAIEEDGRSRFEHSLDRVRQRLIDIEGERGVLIAFGSSADSLTPITTDLDQIDRAVEKLSAGVGQTGFEEALELALSYVRQDELIPSDPAGENGVGGELLSNQPDARIIVFTDGVLPEWRGDAIEVPVIHEIVGEASSNVGITAFAARREFSEAGDLKVLLELRNTGDEAISGSLELIGDEMLLEEEASRTLEAGERWLQTFSTRAGAIRNLQAHWKPENGDALAEDNRAWLSLRKIRPLKVLLVGGNNLILENALAVVENIQPSQLPFEDVDLDTISRDYDVVIWNQQVPEELPAGVGHLVFNAIPRPFWSGTPEVVNQPNIVRWAADDPVLRFSSMAPLDGRILKTRPLPAGKGTRALIEVREGALISRFAAEGLRGLVVSFDILESSWPLSPSFPLFFTAALRDLGRQGSGINSGVRSGELVEARPYGDLEKLYHFSPDGEWRSRSLTRDGRLQWRATDELGVHRFQSTKGELNAETEPGEFYSLEIPVNLLSLAESRIEPRPGPTLGTAMTRPDGFSWGEARREYWPWLLGLGLLALLIEWTVYHRR
ncbi:hypothetical protein CBD41_00655 [bacterium TMED181]|nr:hypothetical protein [Planctomycetota bacterium]OUW47581.1 MAG: hypothetical protein CBD41_00655 [bacterium TMED181]